MLTGNPEAFTILKLLTLWAELPLEVATILGRKTLWAELPLEVATILERKTLWPELPLEVATNPGAFAAFLQSSYKFDKTFLRFSAFASFMTFFTNSF
jgi:hypothetical protein